MDSENSRYFESLREYADEAFVSSHYMGTRLNLGKLSIGYRHASWIGNRNSRVDLVDRGFRYKKSAIFREFPTSLRILEKYPQTTDLYLTEYMMDIYNDEAIEVHRGIIDPFGPQGVFTSNISKVMEKDQGLDLPSFGDLQILSSELQRGAEGSSRIHFTVD